MENKFIKAAREAVVKYYNTDMDPGERPLEYDETFVVWFSKTLQNWKALVSTVRGNSYFELTYNGDKKELYLDYYMKQDNVVMREE